MSYPTNQAGYWGGYHPFVINGTSGNDQIWLYGNYYKINDGPWQRTPFWSTHAVVNGGNGNDYINTAYSNLNHLEINGGKGSDFIVGSQYPNAIYGGKGNDTLYGLSGNDYLNGGHGNDYMNGGWGNDVLYGGSGWDYFQGGPGWDYYVDSKLGPYGMGPYANYYGNSGYHFCNHPGHHGPGKHPNYYY